VARVVRNGPADGQRALEEHADRSSLIQGCQGNVPRAATRVSSSARGTGLPRIRNRGLSVGEPKPLFYEMMSVSALATLPQAALCDGVGAPETCFRPWSRAWTCSTASFRRAWKKRRFLYARWENQHQRDFVRTKNRSLVRLLPAGPSLACLHHLFRTEEMLGYRLASLHNVRWTIRLVAEMRAHIQAGVLRLSPAVPGSISDVRCSDAGGAAPVMAGNETGRRSSGPGLTTIALSKFSDS
jgi:hypothetical protein